MATIKRITLRWAAAHTVYLGRRGENLARTIEIDATPMAEEFPGCTFALLAQRPTEAYAYAATVTEAGGIVSWPVTDVDTGIAGSGRIELRAMLGDVVAKSVTMATVTDKSLDAPTDTDPPEPEHGWLDQALAAQAGAEAAAADAKETLAEVEKKLADGELKGEKGEKGDPGKDGKDAEVTAESVEAALGYAPVKDVQVAGTSVLVDGVAQVPMASSSNLGVVRPGTGIGVDESGHAYIVDATSNHINARSRNNALTPYGLDYAVKAAMCDGKGAEWTAAEQAAARDRMGLGEKYELLSELETTEEVNEILLTLPNTALTSCMIGITLPPCEQIPIFGRFVVNGKYCIYGTNYGNTSYSCSILIRCNVTGGIVTGDAQGQVVSWGGGAIVGTNNAGTIFSGDKIVAWALYTSSPKNPVYPIGTKITVYGVRA